MHPTRERLTGDASISGLCKHFAGHDTRRISLNFIHVQEVTEHPIRFLTARFNPADVVAIPPFRKMMVVGRRMYPQCLSVSGRSVIPKILWTVGDAEQYRLGIRDMFST